MALQLFVCSIHFSMIVSVSSNIWTPDMFSHLNQFNLPVSYHLVLDKKCSLPDKSLLAKMPIFQQSQATDSAGDEHIVIKLTHLKKEC